MEESNRWDLSDEDTENMKMVIDDLIEAVVTFNSMDGVAENDWAELKAVLDFANFVVSGIIYSNGYDLCAGHGHDDDRDGDVEYDDDEGVE